MVLTTFGGKLLSLIEATKYIGHFIFFQRLEGQPTPLSQPLTDIDTNVAVLYLAWLDQA